MKKRIILIAITVLTLALLSGCDAILEGFFPEFADTNSIDVYVQINDTPVVVALIPYDDTDNPMADKIEKQTWYSTGFNASFDGLPEGKYQIYVWYDQNSDGKANEGLARGYARILGSSVTNFIFDSSSTDGDFYTGECDIRTGPYIENPPAGSNL